MRHFIRIRTRIMKNNLKINSLKQEVTLLINSAS